MLYICYDNGAYMNTGIQRSSATPLFADTTTSPAGRESHGKRQWRKDLPPLWRLIIYLMLLRRRPAILWISWPKCKRRYRWTDRRLSTPWPPSRGWRYDTREGIELTRLSVETCYWPLYEVDHGQWKLSYKPREKNPLRPGSENKAAFAIYSLTKAKKK